LEAALERAKRLPNNPPIDFNYAYIYRGIGKLRREQGQPAAALEALREAVRMGETSPGEKPYSTYELACARALCGALAGEGKPESTAGVEGTRRQFADQAMEALRQVVAGGWQNVPWMRVEPDL